MRTMVKKSVLPDFAVKPTCECQNERYYLHQPCIVNLARELLRRRFGICREGRGIIAEQVSQDLCHVEASHHFMWMEVEMHYLTFRTAGFGAASYQQKSLCLTG